MIIIADKQKMALIGNNEKRCSSCGQIKMFDDFCRSKNKKDGKHNCCKKCENLRQKQNRQQNPEKYREDQRAQRKAYKAKNPEKYYSWIARNDIWRKHNPDKVNQYGKRYYKKHADKKKQYYASNKDHLRVLGKAYYHDNAEQIKESDRYARILLCSGTILEHEDIPDELVELKLAQIKLKRLIKKGA